MLTQEEFNQLKVGDLIKGQHSGSVYVITEKHYIVFHAKKIDYSGVIYERQHEFTRSDYIEMSHCTGYHFLLSGTLDCFARGEV